MIRQDEKWDKKIYVPKSHFLFFPLMLALMSKDLTAGMQYIIAMRSDAVDVVACATKPAVTVWTGLVFHVLLEPVLGESLVFYVIGFVFFCEEFIHCKNYARFIINKHLI